MHAMPKHIAILGAGPIGIEAALYARALGLGVTVYDRGPVGANLADWGHVHLFTPWRMSVTPLAVETLRRAGRWPEFPGDVCPSGQEFRDNYLVPLSECEPLRGCVRTEQAVLRVGRERFHKAEAVGSAERSAGGFRLLIADADGVQRIDHADVVIDCTGTYGHHRWAGRGGIPAPGELGLEDRIFYTLPDPVGRDRQQFVDRHTLLLGCGYSAATFLKDIEQLNRSHPVTKVTWAIRRPGLALRAIAEDPLPARRHLVEASLRLAAEAPHWLTFLGSVAVESIAYEHSTFTTQLTELEHAGRDPHPVVRSDSVVALVGYGPDATIYDQLQVQSSYATDGPVRLAAELMRETGGDGMGMGARVTTDSLRNPEPDFYILGAKSYGTNSNFLMRVGHEQVRKVFEIIEGNAAVDLYPALGAL
jgi:hypothetical protein